MTRKIKKFASMFLALVVMATMLTSNLVFASEKKCYSNPLKKYKKLRIIKSDEFKDIALEKFDNLFKDKKIEFSENDFDISNLKLAEMDGKIYATISKKIVL